jgi:peroxin-1
LDGLDSLLGPEHEVSQLHVSEHLDELIGQLTPSSQPTILAELFCRLANPDNLEGIMVIATASSTSALHPLLSTKHVFGETIKIAPLTKERRRDVSFCSGIELTIDTSQTS